LLDIVEFDIEALSKLSAIAPDLFSGGTCDGASSSGHWEARRRRTSNAHELDAAFETLVRQKVNALLVGADPFFTQRDQLTRPTARYGLPAVYEWKESPAAGA
jgi:hypothetical protein